jgi:hypothetical protein
MREHRITHVERRCVVLGRTKDSLLKPIQQYQIIEMTQHSMNSSKLRFLKTKASILMPFTLSLSEFRLERKYAH